MESKLDYIPLPINKLLTLWELKKLISSAHKARSEAIKNRRKTEVIDWMVVNLHLWGLRVSECVYLRCGDVHREYIDLTKTKGLKPRIIIIDPTFSQILREHFLWKKSIGEAIDAKAPFFYSHRKRGWMTRQGIAKAFKRAIQRSHIDKNLSTHSGRHTFASHNELLFAQAQLGHSSIRTTQIYTHALDIQKKAKQYGKKLYSKISKE